MKVPEAITYELEICMFGSAEVDGEGQFTLAETMEEATLYEVELHLRLEQTGQIEVLYEKEFDNEADAYAQFIVLENMFGDASQNVEPDH
jgi:hypothetical protein